MLALSLAITLAYPDAASDVSADLVALVANLPGVVVRALLGTVQLLALLTPVVLVAIAVRWKRPLQVTVAVAAGAIAGLGAALGQHWLDDATPAASVDALTIDSFVTGAAFPSGSYLAGLAAAVTVLSPSFSRALASGVLGVHRRPVLRASAHRRRRTARPRHDHRVRCRRGLSRAGRARRTRRAGSTCRASPPR